MYNTGFMQDNTFYSSDIFSPNCVEMHLFLMDVEFSEIIWVLNSVV